MTQAQKLALTIAILGFLASAGGQLTDALAPFGSLAPLIVKEIISLSTLASGVLGIFLTFSTRQGDLVKAVQAMPGVETILVNKDASPSLAVLAVDKTQEKIEALPQDAKVVAEIAKSN